MASKVPGASQAARRVDQLRRPERALSGQSVQVGVVVVVRAAAIFSVLEAGGQRSRGHGRALRLRTAGAT